jgi:hypothetical protein
MLMVDGGIFPCQLESFLKNLKFFEMFSPESKQSDKPLNIYLKPSFLQIQKRS